MFLHQYSLLNTDTARALYHEAAETCPIIDYHCHINPQEIYEDRRYENITQVWLGGDHYKWRLMRSFGVDEKFITGDASDREEFQKWAETLAMAIGNPLYHWRHLERRRSFGYEGILNGDTAEAVWNLCNEKLRQPDFSARNLILRSDVKVVCTTDDPADTLEWHRKIAADGFPVKVLPSFRPDRAMNLDKPDYIDYLEKLGAPKTYAELVKVLQEKLDFFVSLGCRVSDHAVESVPYAPATEAELEAIFQKRLAGGMPTAYEQKQFKTGLLLMLGRCYAKYGIAMQLHFGCIRDNNGYIYRRLGPDTGVDSIGDPSPLKDLVGFLNALAETNELPRTILYSLNPTENAAIGTIIGCFQGPEARGKLQHGSAWWFNDHEKGMLDQMTTLAAEGHLGTFVGMLTDSRSFLSYTRHEYFRRLLCNLVGGWVERGEFPNDEKSLRTIIEGICYRNAEAYFGF